MIRMIDLAVAASVTGTDIDDTMVEVADQIVAVGSVGNRLAVSEPLIAEGFVRADPVRIDTVGINQL